MLPIVPLKIHAGDSHHKCFVTHAVLDTASTSFFASDSLIERLNVSTISKIKVTTVTTNKAKETHFDKLINHLEFSDLSMSDFFKLEPLLSVTFILISSLNVPKQVFIQQFVELIGFPVQGIYVGLELLIGNNNRCIL